MQIATVADHIEHVVKVAGYDHVGIGGDLDGIPYGVEGLNGVEAYPLLFAELIRRGWSDRNLAKLARRKCPARPPKGRSRRFVDEGRAAVDGHVWNPPKPNNIRRLPVFPALLQPRFF